MRKILCCFAMCFTMINITSILSAHPGHGHQGGSFNLLHYLIEPMHLGIGIIIIGLIGYFIIKKYRRI